MSTTTIEYSKKELYTQQALQQTKWQRLILLFVLGYEGLGGLAGGALLIIEPDGRLMDMPVEMMHGVFRDFMIPGIILFGLGILNTAAFFAVLRKTSTAWFIACVAIYGLAIWFWVEINILQELHWLHFMWGFPVILGIIVAIPLIPYRNATMRKVLLVCGILAGLFYTIMNIIVPMKYHGYSSLNQTISELSAIGSPTRLLWNYMIFEYLLLQAAFGWGVWHSSSQNRNLRIAGILMVTHTIISVFWPPMHQREVLAAGGGTMTDTLHIAFTIATSLLIMLIIGFGAAAFGKWFRLYSIATITIVLVFGILTSLESPALEANLPTPRIGLWERICIFAFMLWFVVLAIILFIKERKPGGYQQ